MCGPDAKGRIPEPARKGFESSVLAEADTARQSTGRVPVRFPIHSTGVRSPRILADSIYLCLKMAAASQLNCEGSRIASVGPMCSGLPAAEVDFEELYGGDGGCESAFACDCSRCRSIRTCRASFWNLMATSTSIRRPCRMNGASCCCLRLAQVGGSGLRQATRRILWAS